MALSKESQIVACLKIGRKFIGIEIDEKHFDNACKRIELAERQPDMFAKKDEWKEMWQAPFDYAQLNLEK